MREMGRKVVREAKQDGRWSRAYAGPASIVVPKDLEKMLDGEEEAKRFFERLGKGDRYAVLWRIETASIKGRAKKIEAMVEILRRGKVPGKTEKVVGRPAVKKRKVGGVKKAKAAKSTSKPTTASTSSKDKTNYVRDEPVRQSRRPGLRART